MTIRVSRHALVAVPVALTAIAAAWYLVSSSGPSDTRPVILPPTFMGLNVATSIGGAAPEEALSVIREDLGGAPIALTTYGEVRVTPVVNVMATRTDLTEKMDLRFLGDNGRLIGNTRCTRNVVLRDDDEGMDKPGSPLSKRDAVLANLRATQHLSVRADQTSC